MVLILGKSKEKSEIWNAFGENIFLFSALSLKIKAKGWVSMIIYISASQNPTMGWVGRDLKTRPVPLSQGAP